MPGRRPLEDVGLISTVHWLMLALVIEKPSYGYEIAARYERRFGLLLPTSKTSIYGSLDRLEQEGLVEPLPPQPTPMGGRHRRVSYGPTTDAIPTHRRWLSSPVVAARWHDELLARIGTAHLHGVAAMLDLLERYAHYAEQHQQRVQELMTEHSPGGQQSLQTVSAALLLTEQQGTATAHIDWVRAARDEVKRLGRNGTQL